MDCSGILYLLEKHAPRKPATHGINADEIRVLAAKQTLRRIGGKGKKMPKYALATIHAKYMELGSVRKTGKVFGVSGTAISNMFRRYGLPMNHLGRRPELIHNGERYALNEDGFYRGTRQKSGFPLHRVMWEERNGPIPKGFVLVFMSDDRTDFSDKNLRLMTRHEALKHAQAVRWKVRNQPQAA